MKRRWRLVSWAVSILVGGLSQSWGQVPAENKRFTEAPKLEARFEDNFKEDTRKNYLTGPRKDAVSWQPGSVTLSSQSYLSKLIRCGSWARIDFDISFPKLTRDSQTSEFKVWANLNNNAGSFVWFRQRRQAGKVFSAILVVVVPPNNSVTQQKSRIISLLDTDQPLVSGKWSIEYRAGLWTLVPPESDSNFRAFIEYEEPQLGQFTLEAKAAVHEIRSLSFASDRRVAFDATPQAKSEILQGNKWSEELSKYLSDKELKAAIEVGKKLIKNREDTLGKYHVAFCDAIGSLAFAWNEAGEYDKSIALSEEALKIRRQTLGPNHPTLAITLNNLAVVKRRKSRYSEALELFLQARDILRNVYGKKHPTYAQNLNNLASTYKSLGQYLQAEELYAEAAKRRKDLFGEKSLAYAQAINNRASNLVELGDFRNAISLTKQALSIRAELLSRKHPDYAESLSNLAAVYSQMGQVDQVETLLLESLEIKSSVFGKRHISYADSLMVLAGFYSRLGMLEKAEPLFLEVLSIQEEKLGKNSPPVARSLDSLGRLYLELSDYAKAEEFLLLAASIRQAKLGDQHADFASSLNNLAALYHHMKKPAEVEKLLNTANEIISRSKGKKDPDYAAGLNNLASHYMQIGKYKNAEKLFLEALEINEKLYGNFDYRAAGYLDNLAGLYQRMKRFKEAEDFALRSKRILEESLGKKHPIYVDCIGNLASYYICADKDQQATPLLKERLKLSQEHMQRFSSIQSQRQQSVFANRSESAFSFYLSHALRNQWDPNEVYRQTVHWKGKALLRQRELTQLNENPAASAAFAKLRVIKSQLSRHLQIEVDGDTWKTRYQELSRQEEALERQVSQLAARTNSSTATPIIPANLNLTPNIKLIDFRKFVYSYPDPSNRSHMAFEPRFVAFLISHAGVEQMVDLGAASEIESWIYRWRKPIETANQFSRPIDVDGQRRMDRAARQLKGLVWDPVSSKLGSPEIVIVSPDGALGRLPFAALPGNKAGTYLIEDAKIVNIPVPLLLASLLKTPSKAITKDSKALAMGFVDFGFENLTKTNLPLPRNRSVFGNWQFQNLPNTEQEIQAVGENFRKAKLLQGKYATEEYIKQNAGKFELFHIATHGFFKNPMTAYSGGRSPVDPSSNRLRSVATNGYEVDAIQYFNPNLMSGLAFANANNATSNVGAEDGILFSAEIAFLPLKSIQLAVLSACETGLGAENSPGEGLIGIQRAFQVAGTKTTIASYWKVDDRATQLLMNKFYDNLINPSSESSTRGKSKLSKRIDALRDAQLWMLNNPIIASQTNRGAPVEVDPDKIKSLPRQTDSVRRTHPRYWAPFVLSGDWR